MSNSALLLHVCASDNKGAVKHDVPSALVRAEHGIDVDAHAGDCLQPTLSQGRCPVRGLSEPLYAELIRLSQVEEWACSPVGGLSLPEFRRLANTVTQ